MLKRNNTIISGITGQDGAFLAKKLIGEGQNIIGLLRPKKKSEQITFRLKELGIYEKIKFEEIDLLDSKKVEDLIKNYKPDSLFHLGAQTSVEKSFFYKELTKDSNIRSSMNLINSVKQFSEKTRFIFPSSSTIYEGYKNKTVNELTLAKPLSTYAKSKFYIQEQLESMEIENFTIGIMFSHESEFRRSNFFTQKIVHFLWDYKNGNRKILHIGNINIERDIGHAEDYMNLMSMFNSETPNNKYIISSNKLVSLKQFIVSSLNYLNIDFEVELHKNNISFISKVNGKPFIVSESKNFRKIDLLGIKGSNQLAKKDFDWTPKHDLEKIVEKMIDYRIKSS